MKKKTWHGTWTARSTARGQNVHVHVDSFCPRSVHVDSFLSTFCPRGHRHVAAMCCHVLSTFFVKKKSWTLHVDTQNENVDTPRGHVKWERGHSTWTRKVGTWTERGPTFHGEKVFLRYGAQSHMLESGRSACFGCPPRGQSYKIMLRMVVLEHRAFRQL